ncbi:hypothetical protein RHMOL_Rhmol01G0117800 [Rhododendron molle]|uniref:Uncharacterized protein n=1 Tax=Rhododendron molle TaxID=49168 RepID=A0ACC0Q3F5_RHOML|nr:hypothetical protein RHMOL_Rhmol01G0117800 [Rhododendron molle]
MSIFFILLFLLLHLSTSQQDDDCAPTRCSKHGPTIRFPFRQNNHHLPHCGYPGFDLSCSPNKATLLNLPYSVQVLVTDINYTSQIISIKDPNSCFLQQFHNLNLSSTPFRFANKLWNMSFFSCPSTGQNTYWLIPCLSGDGHDQVYAYYGFSDFTYFAPTSCRKMYNVWSVPHGAISDHGVVDMQLKWPDRVCGKCGREGKFCRFVSNSSTSDRELECFNPPENGVRKRPPVIAGVTLGSFLLLVTLIAMYLLHKQKKEDHLKIERFLEDYRALKPARYSYADIKKITNQFKDKVGQGGYGTVYRGQLSNDVHVAVKILNNTKGNGEDFINEVGIIGKIHHVNVVRFVGYCADGFRRALIYEFLPNDSLEKFALSNHDKHFLGWKKLLEIALGIAKGIEYLHQGCDRQILHFDIKPHNILLDKKLNPKITDFGQAKLCSKEQSVVSMTTARGTIGYIAPEVFSRNFGNVSYKSDIYSFGMLLLEMVGGKKNSELMVNNTNQVNYFPEWVYVHLNSGEELGIGIQDEEDAKIAKKLAIVGLWCIQWYPVDRPSMHVVIQMLEGDGDMLIKPPNPFVSTNPTMVSGQASGTAEALFNSNLEVIVEHE